jgi:phospholipid/cholesterol/gamma-HCH transport system permease protein
MAVMGVNPLARVVAPRFWAGLFSLPILTALFNVMGIIGGYYVGVVMIGLDEGSYWAQMQNAVDLHDDVINGLIKSLFFGVAVTLIAVFEGYDAEATAAGVSAATTRTVVTSALVILAMDFVLTAFMF